MGVVEINLMYGGGENSRSLYRDKVVETPARDEKYRC